MMKSVISSLAAASALVIGVPAVAQVANGYQTPNGYQNQNGGYQNPQYQNGNGVGAQTNLAARIGQLQTRIQSGVQSGAIDRAEARRLRQQLRQLVQLERQYSANGLTGPERSELQQRRRNLRQQVRTADGGANGQYDQYDRDDGYGQVQGNQGQYGQPQYGQPPYGQDVNGGYQQPVQPVQPRSGLGGIVDRVLGTGGLRVGQQATGNLYAVPNEYRNQYRDNNNSYYRSDGRQIYQIDARSQTVVQVYPLSR